MPGASSHGCQLDSMMPLRRIFSSLNIISYHLTSNSLSSSKRRMLKVSGAFRCPRLLPTLLVAATSFAKPSAPLNCLGGPLALVLTCL